MQAVYTKKGEIFFRTDRVVAKTSVQGNVRKIQTSLFTNVPPLAYRACRTDTCPCASRTSVAEHPQLMQFCNVHLAEQLKELEAKVKESSTS